MKIFLHLRSQDKYNSLQLRKAGRDFIKQYWAINSSPVFFLPFILTNVNNMIICRKLFLIKVINIIA